MIEFQEVSKPFWTGTQRKVILDRASFRVDLGRSLGILAPNGAGKTTIINMMAGLEKPDEGTIRKTYAESIEANSVHGSDSDENAANEIKFFFRDDELVG